jgi:hypothetical protein
MRTEFDALATALFGPYWGEPLKDADILKPNRTAEIKAGGEPTLEEQRALVDLAFLKRAEISQTLRAVQSNVLKCLGVEA